MVYRDRVLACPGCGGALPAAGKVRACPAGCGAWIAAEVLTEMIADLHHGAETRPLDLQPGLHAVRRACPACAAVMVPAVLEQTEVERCAIHGLWLDGGELERILLAASARPPRADGVRVDLSPLPTSVSGRTPISEAAIERIRAHHLARWIAATLPALSAQLAAEDGQQLDAALLEAEAAIARRPDDARPSAELAQQLHARLADATGTLAAIAAAIQPWCWAHAITATALAEGAATADTMRAHLAALPGPLPRGATSELAEALAQFGALIAQQRAALAGALAASRAGDAAACRAAVGRFVRTLIDADDAMAALLVAVA